MNQNKSNPLAKPEQIAFGLLLFTVLTWTLCEFVLVRQLNITPTDPQHVIESVTALTDARESGTSQATLAEKKDGWELSYDLRKGAPYPFAMIHIILDQNGAGEDLSGFEEILISATTKGSKKKRLRIQLRNYSPHYVRKGDPVSLKYNEAHFPPGTPTRLRWANFQVPGWWLAKKNIPFEDSTIDVSNITWIELVTPELATAGDRGTIILNSIQFRGKLIPKEIYLTILLAIWMTASALFGFARITQLRKLVATKVARETELLHLNQALAIEAAQMKQHAHHDELTGLMNRMGLREKLVGVITQAAKHNVNLNAIFVDIDYFKQINDSFGHDVGDQMLRLVASTLKKSIRKTDLLARWGGEEFVIICQGGTVDDTAKLAEKLRRTIELLPEDLSCSFGVADLASGSLKSMINRADMALYQAKENGRNRVEVSRVVPKRHSVPSVI